jgi:hypothetical protein
MPIRKVKGGYKWGNHGHTYPTRKGAQKQAAAAHANGYHEDGLDEHTRMALDSLYSPPSKESK